MRRGTTCSDALPRWEGRRARRCGRGAGEHLHLRPGAKRPLASSSGGRPLLQSDLDARLTADRLLLVRNGVAPALLEGRRRQRRAGGHLTGRSPEFPSSVSPDGRTLAYAAVPRELGGTDIWLLGLDGKRERRAWFETPFKEFSPFFSPDGGLIAYTAEESGTKPEIYVRPYPGPGGRIKISGSDGGSEPLWSPDGSELYLPHSVRRN